MTHKCKDNTPDLGTRHTDKQTENKDNSNDDNQFLAEKSIGKKENEWEILL